MLTTTTTTADAQNETEQLRAAFWHSLGQTTDALTLTLGPGANATPQFIGALSELALMQIGVAARDVESFARHAGRTTVEAEDILMLARRSEDLERMLKGRLQEARAS